jgi:fumarate hydratase class II
MSNEKQQVRIEKDSMGEMEVPVNALYGASTQRAVLNFPISQLKFPPIFIKALGIIKKAAAISNAELGLLDEKISKAIVSACDEVIDGKLNQHFVVDIFQTGSGTSSNMNANEVIANRAVELLGGLRGDKSIVHPNDHVNMSQSSNDIIPSSIHLATVVGIEEDLLPSMKLLADELTSKADEFKDVIKSGRTHLQDATPITLGQEFSGYATQVNFGIERVKSTLDRVRELAQGGTAVGTGLNTHPEFPQKVVEEISKISGVKTTEARNHFEAQGARDAIVELSGQLKTYACSLMKIANDIRWLAAGPRCSLAEIQLPEIQPGSSIMPGKVNPVVCESVMMVASQVIGNDACITTGGQHGNFELNVMLPVIGYNILQSIEILASSSKNFKVKCIEGIKANREKCLEYAEASLATCTSLAPIIGYDAAAKIAKKAFAEGKTVREVAKAEKILEEDELNKALDLMAMTKPGV